MLNWVTRGLNIDFADVYGLLEDVPSLDLHQYQKRHQMVQNERMNSCHFHLHSQNRAYCKMPVKKGQVLPFYMVPRWYFDYHHIAIFVWPTLPFPSWELWFLRLREGRCHSTALTKRSCAYGSGAWNDPLQDRARLIRRFFVYGALDRE